MSKLRDYVDIVKTKDLTAEKLKKLYDNNGYIALLTGGKSFGYTKEILPEYLQQGEILAIPVGGSFNVKYHNGFYYNANNYILQTKESLDIKYLYYQLQNKKTLIDGLYQGWGCKKLKIQSLLNLEIKLPCILKQKEIVKVLDLLTSSTKELTNKIFDKDKQYKYYLSELFNMKSEFLQKLLEGKKVEWRTLGEVAEYVRGLTYSKTDESQNKEGYKVLRANNITLSNNIINFEDVKIVKFSTKVKETQKLYKDDILISSASGSREHVGKVAFIYNDIDYYFGGFMGVVRCNNALMPRFLFHILISNIFQNYLNEVLNSSTINNISLSIMNDFPIPIPPMEVQMEVVRILDLLTSHTTELNKELIARKKQYEYYRNKLLTFGEGEAEWKALGEVGDIKMCKRILKNQTSSLGDIPFYKIGTFGKEPNAFISKELYLEYRQKYSFPKIGDILISASGTIGRVVIYDGKPAYYQDSNIVWIDNNEKVVLNKYLWHFYKVAKWNVSTGGTIDRLYNDDLRRVKIPIPPLSKQQEIVEVLDKFDALTNSITEGLPREIELRQKQYEYYRNKLLLST